MVVPIVALLLQGKLILVSPHAMRVDALLAEMSAKTGEPHRASPRMAGRIVLSVGPARPAATIRADLAAATWGAWRRTPTGWTLEEDEAGVKERDQARLVRRIASVARSQALFAKKVSKPFDAAAARDLKNRLNKADPKPNEDHNEVYGRYHAMEGEFPAMVALRRIILSFKPEELAALSDGRIVLSDRPTRLQRVLPNGAVAAIAALERDQNVWAAANADAGSEFAPGRLLADPREFNDPVSPGGLRVVIQTNVSRTDIRFQAWFVDKTMRAWQFAETDIDATSSPLMTTAPATDPTEKPLALGGESDAYAAALAGKGTVAMRTKLLNPEKNEPLDLYTGEIVRAIARERKAATTIWLDDNLVAFAFDTFHRASKDRPNTTSEWIKQLWIRAFNANERPGAIVFRPRGAATNVERAKMGAFLRAADALGYVSLDDLADYAAIAPEEDSLPMLSSQTLNGLLPGAGSATMREDWKALRLWGSFSRMQRAAFARGATLRFNGMLPEQQGLFVDAIVNADTNEIQGEREGHDYLVLDNEPTELLAGGFRVDGGVTGTLTVEDGVFARSEANDPNEMWSSCSATAWELAYGTVERERKPGAPQYDGLPNVLTGRYVPGRILNYTLNVPLSRTLRWSKGSAHPEFDVRAQPQPLESMPLAFLQAYRKALEELRRQPANP